MITWTKEEVLILVDNYSAITKNEILKKLPLKTWDGIRKKAKRLGLVRFKEVFKYTVGNRQTGLNKGSQEILRDINKYQTMYEQGKRLGEIARATGTCIKTISKLFEIAKVNKKDKSNAHRRHSLNEFFFDIIDTEEKAYFLGFMFADGFIFKKANNFMIGLEIKDDDIALLQRYRQAISSSSPIKTHHYKDRNSVKLRVYSRHMVEQLIKKGCAERKSLTLKFPSTDIVPENLLHHFMRGYFDGDGSIKRSSNPKNQRNVQVEIVSSNCFLPVFMQKLNTYAGVNMVKITLLNNGNFSSFTYGGKGNATKIYNFLYRDATIFLKRKYDRFIDYLSIPHILKEN